MRIVLGLVGGLALLWLALIVALWAASRGRDPITLRETLRLIPDVLRLIRRLTADPEVPRRVRVQLLLLLGYLLLPLDVVPDFLPVIGYADDALVVAVALRSVVRAAGPDALARHWPGTPLGLATLHRLCRLPPQR